MATSQSTIDFLLDQLADCRRVTARKMFGEYCLYFDGLPVGLVCDNQLFLKNTVAVRALLHEVVEVAPYPRAKPHLLIAADLWDDRTSLCQWVRATADALMAALLQSRKDAPHATPKAAKKAGKAGAALADLPGLGPKSQHMLVSAGIRSVSQLRKWGAVAAYARVKRAEPSASLNLLWALEGALTGLPWQVVARDHRTSLLLALEQLQSAAKDA